MTDIFGQSGTKSKEKYNGVVDQQVIDSALNLWGKAGKYSILSIRGNSMAPSILNGDEILIIHDLNGIAKGDLIVFRQSNRVVVHRIVGIKHENGIQVYVTKGDNSLRIDPLVHINQIIGRVIGIEHNKRIISTNTHFWRSVGWMIANLESTWLFLMDNRLQMRKKLFTRRRNQFIHWMIKLGHFLFLLPKRAFRLILIR